MGTVCLHLDQLMPMQTSPSLIKQPKPPRFLMLFVWGVVASAAYLVAKSPQHTVESRGAPDREYRLFVGVDIKIFHQDDFAVVTDFSHSIAEVEGATNNAKIDVRNASRVRFEPTTKVGRAPITIGAIKTTRAYSARNDPRRQWASRQAQVQAYQTEQQDQQVSILSTAVQYAGNGIATTDDDGNTFFNPAIAQADNQLAAFKADTAALTDNQFYAQRGQEAEASGQEDALVVEAMMSSPQPISNAYVVGIARVQKDGVQNDIIFFDDLGELGPEPRKVKVRKDGLPANLEVLEVSLHVFREGQELVSDQSDKQFALTREEALEYLTLAHTSSHRGQTLPAEPVWSLAPPALFAAKNPDQFEYALRVSIDDRGRVVAIDENAIVPDHIRAIVNDLVFIPALSNGLAVASDVSFNLGDFFR